MKLYVVSILVCVMQCCFAFDLQKAKERIHCQVSASISSYFYAYPSQKYPSSDLSEVKLEVVYCIRKVWVECQN